MTVEIDFLILFKLEVVGKTQGKKNFPFSGKGATMKISSINFKKSSAVKSIENPSGKPSSRSRVKYLQFLVVHA